MLSPMPGAYMDAPYTPSGTSMPLVNMNNLLCMIIYKPKDAIDDLFECSVVMLRCS